MGSDDLSLALSLVALIAAVASLALQARDMFATRHQTIRGAQLELVRMAIEEPSVYLGYEPDSALRIQFAHRGYINVFLKYFELGFLTGTLGETEIRHQMRDLFANEGPREIWPAIRATWRIDATSRRKRKFVEIVEREFSLVSRPTTTTDHQPTDETG